ncbi:MAG TPA: hypothetical protein VNN72_21050 [Polyangiaceae bacterium]|nr:hypothetical protein [Polyangiaceae bacterium]
MTASARPLLLVIALALAACGASDEPDEPNTLGPLPHYRIPGCEAYDTAPCDVRDAACQLRLMQIAVCLRQDEPADLPPVSVVSETEYASILTERVAGRAPTPNRDELEWALSRFGLVMPGALRDDAMVLYTATHIDGEFRPDMQDVLIIDHGAKTDIAEASNTLVHEFVHALQYRELSDFGDGYVSTFDTHLALKSLIEGEARFHELRYRAPMLGLDPRHVDWERTFENGVSAAETWVLKQDSPFLAVTVLPYGWGSRLFSFDWNETGHAGVLARFADPPTTTHALMASVHAYEPDDFTAPDIALPELPSGWSAIGHEVFGAVGTFLVLARYFTPDEARELALAWRGDTFTVLQRTAQSTNVGTVALWSVEFASEAAATSAASRITLTALGTTRATGTRLTVVVSDRTTDVTWALPTE